MLDWRWLFFVAFCWLATALFRRLWSSYDPPMIPTWDYPEYLTAEDREWVGKHLALTGWQAPVNTLARIERQSAITSSLATPLYRVSPGSSCQKRQAVHDQFCTHIECAFKEPLILGPDGRTDCQREMKRQEEHLLRLHAIPPNRVGPPIRNAMYEGCCALCERPLAAHRRGRCEMPITPLRPSPTVAVRR